MAYRIDSDLEFLSLITSNDLNDLVYCLTHDKDGNTRLTEELTYSDTYKLHYPNHNKYWKLIAAEVQCYGANSIATMFRGGEGVLYREVLQDVCNKLKVNYNNNSKTEIIENNLLLKILTSALEEMSPEDLKELAKEFNISNINYSSEALLGAFQAVFNAGGFKSYQLTLIVANTISKVIIGKGLSFATNTALTKTMSILTGPIGWGITGAWTLFDISGPAFRVTLPAVINIAVLRKKNLQDQEQPNSINKQKTYENREVINLDSINNLETQNKLAKMYFEGINVKKNFSKAFELSILPAKNGNKESQQRLSILYKNGWGTTKDVELSKYWATQANY